MKTVLRTISCLSLAIAAFLAPFLAQAVPVYTWTGFYKDTGMAQFAGLTVANGQLLVGSENFNPMGDAKLTSFTTSGTQADIPVPHGNASIDRGREITAADAYAFESNWTVEINAFSSVWGTDSAHVYVLNGTTFTDITPTAAAFSTNLGVYALATYGTKLFIGTGGSAGSAQVWAFDGKQWAQQSLPGFPSNNYYVWSMAVYNNVLYAGTVDYSQAAQVWKYDGTAWSMVSVPGFSSSNYAVGSMAVYNDKLYIGTSSSLGSGAEIWSYDGTTWTKLPGFAKNDAATSMAVYNNALYIGTTNYTQGVSAQLWSYDGTTLSQVAASSDFTKNGANSGIVSLEVFNGTLYAGTYNNTGAEVWSVTASGTSSPGPTPTLPGALTGLWWNPNESGWGVHYTQRGGVIFAAWFTYDSSGKPTWYVASDCTGMTGTSGTCNGTLYQAAGPAFFGAGFNANSVNLTNVGSVQLSFTDANTGSMTYSLNGLSRSVSVQRQPVGAGTLVPDVDHTDLWWNPGESGWGMAMAQMNANIFLAWFVYDASGKPMWYVASNCAVSGNGCTGSVYSTTGPPMGPTFDSTQVHIGAVGTITVSFTDPNNAVLTYTVNGVSGTKSITRQLF
jgi:hypothetical protein